MSRNNITTYYIGRESIIRPETIVLGLEGPGMVIDYQTMVFLLGLCRSTLLIFLRKREDG